MTDQVALRAAWSAGERARQDVVEHDLRERGAWHGRRLLTDQVALRATWSAKPRAHSPSSNEWAPQLCGAPSPSVSL